MPTVLHLLKGPPSDLTVAAIERAVAAGDRVTVALLEGAPATALPGVELRHVPRDLSYADLLDLVFASDHVIAW
jgi:hypothetical protein